MKLPDVISQIKKALWINIKFLKVETSGESNATYYLEQLLRMLFGKETKICLGEKLQNFIVLVG